MPQPDNEAARPEIAHIVARLLGEESRDHLRQKAVARLRARGLEDRVADFNKSYDRHSRDYLPPRDAVDRAISDTLGWGDLSTFYAPGPPVGGEAGAGAPGAGAPAPADVHPEAQPPVHPRLGS